MDAKNDRSLLDLAVSPGGRPVPHENIVVVSPEAMGRLAAALADLAGRISVREPNSTDNLVFSHVSRDDGSLVTSVTAGNTAATVVLAKGEWRETEGAETIARPAPDLEGLIDAFRPIVTSAQEREAARRDGIRGAQAAVFVFDRSTESLTALSNLVTSRPEVKPRVDRWLADVGEMLVWKIALAPDTCLISEVDDERELVEVAFPHLAQNTVVFPDVILRADKLGDAQASIRISDAWVRLGGKIL